MRLPRKLSMRKKLGLRAVLSSPRRLVELSSRIICMVCRHRLVSYRLSRSKAWPSFVASRRYERATHLFLAEPRTDSRESTGGQL
jgi:hypothetical protein